LEYVASFGGSWLTQTNRIADALKALELRPSEMEVVLNGIINLERVRAGLPAAGWIINSHLPDKVSATRSGYNLSASGSSLIFSGFSPSELLGSDGFRCSAPLGKVGDNVSDGAVWSIAVQ
jgi:hypothetical protein